MNERDLEHKIHTFMQKKLREHPELNRSIDSVVKDLR